MREAIELLSSSVEGFLEAELEFLQLAIFAHFSVVDDEITADSFFDGLKRNSAIQYTAFADDQVSVGNSVTIENPDQRWAYRFQLEKSGLGDADVFLSCNGTYMWGGAYESFAAKIDHFDTTVRSYFRCLGLEAESESEDAAPNS